jgi:hypothetical protein
MQTFLPYENFEDSAKCLDYRRLGKQRVECLQLLQALADGGAWANHPAAKMWQGYETALVKYGLVITLEWKARGYKDTCYEKLCNAGAALEGRLIVLPPWLGDEAFHAAHRSNLLRKDPTYYGQFGWAEPDDLPYIWPV